MIVNMGLWVFVAATGCIGILSSDSFSDTGLVFVGLYLMMFSFVGFIFEFAQLKADSSLDNLIKRNFGFLYGPLGKGSYQLL